MKKGEHILSTEKWKELKQEQETLFDKLKAALADLSPDTHELGLTTPMPNGRRTVYVEFYGIKTEAALRRKKKWVENILEGMHYITKKGYLTREGVLKYYFNPDWEYYMGEKYTERMKPAPQPVEDDSWKDYNPFDATRHDKPEGVIDSEYADVPDLNL